MCHVSIFEKKMKTTAIVLFALVAFASAAPAFVEEFGAGWNDRWIKTGHSKFTGIMAAKQAAWSVDEDQVNILIYIFTNMKKIKKKKK